MESAVKSAPQKNKINFLADPVNHQPYRVKNLSLKKTIYLKVRTSFPTATTLSSISENSPKPLAVESCLACNPGGEPACVLVFIRAAHLI